MVKRLQIPLPSISPPLRALRASNAGLTLVEITIAMTLLVLILAVSAQALAGFVVAMEMHGEQTVAIQSARSVLGALREKRPELRNEFPMAFAEWISEQNDAGWTQQLLEGEHFGTLHEHAIQVALSDMDGDTIGLGDNPIVVTVTTTWTGVQGRPMRAVVSTIMTDR
jgi:hypothetical protein